MTGRAAGAVPSPVGTRGATPEIPGWLFLAAALLVVPASAATVDVGPLVTTFAITVFPPRVTSIDVPQAVTVDLSPLADLTPGSDIAITFSTADALIWTGGFGADTGDLTLLCHARLTLSVGTYTTSSDDTWSFGPVPWDASFNPADPVAGDPVGYITGPVPQPLTLTVPWGTDLSEVSLTLTDLFSVEGVDPYINFSRVTLGTSSLTTASVPDPAAGLLGLLAAALGFTRRRRIPQAGSIQQAA